MNCQILREEVRGTENQKDTEVRILWILIMPGVSIHLSTISLSVKL